MDRFKKHPIVAFLAICVTVSAGTWAVCEKVLIAPMEKDIDRLKNKIQELENQRGTTSSVLEKISIRSNTSATTSDGLVMIHANVLSYREAADIIVTIGTNEPTIFKGLKTGERVPIQAPDATYYVDIHQFRGGLVDIAVSKSPRT